MSIKKGRANAHPKEKTLLLAEGLTVGTLIHGGIALVGTYQNTVQSAVVAVGAVVGALMNGALDALVGIAVHIGSSFFGDGISMAEIFTFIQNIANKNISGEKSTFIIDIFPDNHYNICGNYEDGTPFLQRKENCNDL